MFGTAFLNSILFSTNASCANLYPKAQRSTEKCQAICGGIAGFSQAIVTCPMEYIKIKMQVIDKTQKTNPKFFHILKKYCNSPAGIKQLYTGMAVTLMRDVPGFAVYFSTNQLIINQYKKSKIGKFVLFLSQCNFRKKYKE